jgi:hypothetical protein
MANNLLVPPPSNVALPPFVTTKFNCTFCTLKLVLLDELISMSLEYNVNPTAISTVSVELE